MSQKMKLGGCTVIWDKKSVDYEKDGVLHFKDGDFFNSVTGNGLHRYGTLRIVGKCQIADANADSMIIPGWSLRKDVSA